MRRTSLAVYTFDDLDTETSDTVGSYHGDFLGEPPTYVDSPTECGKAVRFFAGPTHPNVPTFRYSRPSGLAAHKRIGRFPNANARHTTDKSNAGHH